MNADYLTVLRCPQCKGELTAQEGGLLCAHDQLLFPIRDGMPIMLIEQAIQVSHDD
ncbi:MAG: Trm112 family protein [Formosimonas sp.]